LKNLLSKISIIGLILSLSSINPAHPRALCDPSELDEISTNKTTFDDEPFVTVRVHDIGRIGLTVSNQGHFGDGFIQGATNPFGGEAPSCGYPFPGQQNYLFAGAFWVGAVVGRDTLVSVGADGWRFTREMWPEPYPRGDMIYRSISGPEAAEAVSEQDFIAVYHDTLTAAGMVDIDPFDGRPHIPLNIEVIQRSYAWSYSYAEDFVLFDYSIKNIGFKELNQVYMGFYVDADVNHGSGSGIGHDDDICGFKQSVPSPYGCGFIDTINIAYIADNDGRNQNVDPCPYDPGSSLTGVTGMRVVRTPSDSLQYAFNWWISNGVGALDFGPRQVGTQDDPFRDFGGFLGTPEGDKNKYYIMMHGEFDYDQLFCALDHTASGWLPADAQAANFADGYDTRYLLSFGPFDIDPGEVLPISFAYVAADNFHTDCEAFNDLFDARDPYVYYNTFDFEDFGRNSVWASWIYDNPGFDTDGDGYYGKYRICPFDSVLTDSVVQEYPLIKDTFYVYTEADTVFYEGDGVPDFRGASPPPPPELWVVDTSGDTLSSRIHGRLNENYGGDLIIRWNGYLSETTKDVFSNLYDFEGYRVYYSLTAKNDDFYQIASYDLDDYNKWIWNGRRRIWELKDPPFSLESLRESYGAGFNPLDYDIDHPFYLADSTLYFAAQDFNESNWHDTTKIHKLYPDLPPPTTLNLDSARTYFPEELTPEGNFKYYEYQFVLRNLLPSQLHYIAVTAFDYGSPGTNLQSLETRPGRNYVAEYAMPNNTIVEQNNLNVIVFPNPYRADGQYLDYGFEGRDYLDSAFGGILIPQENMIEDRTRSIHFINLPHRCTIRIFSIDGDLVREIEHDYPKDSPRSMHERWDMITRNTQAVVSGIYYYSVESEYGSQIGKLVIIL
jgi:hypothetical protein